MRKILFLSLLLVTVVLCGCLGEEQADDEDQSSGFQYNTDVYGLYGSENDTIRVVWVTDNIMDKDPAEYIANIIEDMYEDGYEYVDTAAIGKTVSGEFYIIFKERGTYGD